MPSDNLSTPTQEQILVPETLLKKRKSQEKAREERSAELEKKKKVRSLLIFSHAQYIYEAFRAWSTII